MLQGSEAVVFVIMINGIQTENEAMDDSTLYDIKQIISPNQSQKSLNMVEQWFESII